MYDAIGEAGFERLVGAFYAQVPGDDILGPMYPQEDLPGAEERLRDFLVFRFGGPPRYAERRGIPYVLFPQTDGAHEVKDIRSGDQWSVDPASWTPPVEDLRPQVVSTSSTIDEENTE